MHVFFEKFIPSFPVLHKPIFSPRGSSSPLLLNIIAVGFLFVGAKDAIHKGEALWRLAHTAVATSWQALTATKGPRDGCNGVQLVLTALLGQTYASSKNESLRMTSQIFHSLGFSSHLSPLLRTSRRKPGRHGPLANSRIELSSTGK
jgi:Fungal specific transcription factor domain